MKSTELQSRRKTWSRDLKRLKFYNKEQFIIDEACRYQEYLEKKDVRTKAEIAEIFGVSRAQVT